MKSKNIILIAAAALMTLGGCCQQKKTNECQECSKAVSFDEVVATRRCVRDFAPDKTISEQEVREIIAAAQEAPSWRNFQESRYYVAISPEKVAAAKLACGRNAERIANAPVMIASSFVKGLSGFNDEGKAVDGLGDGWGAYDNGLSNAYLVMKARAMGFDTLIMGGRDAEAIRGIFGIPQDEEITVVIALGYRASDPKRPERFPIDDVVKFF